MYVCMYLRKYLRKIATVILAMVFLIARNFTDKICFKNKRIK